MIPKIVSKILILVVVEIINTMEIVSHPISRNYIETTMQPAHHLTDDISKAQKILGYQPQISLLESLKQEWFWIHSLYI